MKVERCDRCPRVGAKLVQMLEFELCPSCIADFRLWIRHTKGLPRPGAPVRLRNGTAWRIITEIIEEHGSITPEQYGAATGKTGREPYYALRYFVKKGELESDQLSTGTTFFLARPWTRKEAAE
jgi:hypothetical protein